MKKTLSVAIATYNEGANIAGCLDSVVSWVNEIVIVDGGSQDNTVTIAQKYNAKVIKTNNPPIFHVNKQKALDACKSDWILQLDADERVSPGLAQEILKVIENTTKEIDARLVNAEKQRLFFRHQELVEARDGKVGHDQGDIVAFYIPRRNYFLGKPMTYAGMYPDGVIRLIKRGKAWFPAKSVHEQIHVEGRVSWLYHDLLHLSNPTFSRYFSGANRYTNLLAHELRSQRQHSSIFMFFYYMIIKPFETFFSLFVRHKGVLDGIHGFLFALFSSLHYPAAYIKSWKR